MKTYKLSLPLDPQVIHNLKRGDKILLSGVLYTARDQVHARLAELIHRGEDIPIPLSEGALFYCGPSPTPPGKISGAIGPTTSSRMDRFTPLLLEQGLQVMLGKGERSPEVESAIRKHGALYLVCVGGISALLTKSAVSRETFLWPELGAEAVYRIVVQDFPCYVALS
ncbi:MAG: FumA C-terminus/TtdB family hydratase beta subunit [Candidatus Syntrophosphaera sp.]|nr:FumA C-terminus/TtdB family hydratase beta subunit [Candidatus Syntrophosphaera sp.]